MKFNFYYTTWMTSIPWALLTLLSANKTWISVFVSFQIGVFPSTLISSRALPRLTVLGIELDSMALRARLPQEKFDRIALLDTWSSKQHCTRKELESLIGHLQHPCKVIPPGRTFLRRMINLLSAFRRDDHPIRLYRDFRFNLTWWREFFHSWDGFSFLLAPQWAPLPDFHISSDAAGAQGYGAIFYDQWFVGSTTFVYRIQGIIPIGSGGSFVGPSQYGCSQCLALGHLQGS